MTDRYVTTRNWDLDFAEEVNIQFYIDITIFQTTTTKTTLTHTYIFHEISTINKPTNSSFAHLSIHTRKFPIHQRLPAMTPRQQDLFWRVHKNKSSKRFSEFGSKCSTTKIPTLPQIYGIIITAVWLISTKLERNCMKDGVVCFH